MAVIDVSHAPVHREVESGIRPFDVGRDLRPVAELIADAFTNELDPRGKAALREMRIMSHVSGLLKILSRGTGELDDVFSGFVWTEDGRIVGNITVQRADKYGSRWQIANVAVLPSYRGRGIARRLMDRGLQHVRECDGEWAVLQVYDHNAVAQKLYADLGFQDVGSTADLQLDVLPKVDFPENIPNFRQFSSGQWQPLFELAANQLNTQAQWWRSIRRSDFHVPLEQKLSEWFWRTVGKKQVYRRCIQTSRRFEAALILTAQRWRGMHQMQLWVRPDQYGRFELALLQWVLATLQGYPRAPVQVSLSGAHSAALDGFQQFGFKRLQTLITMRKAVRE